MKSNQVALFGVRPLVRIMLCCCGGFLIANVLESTAVTTGIFLSIFALLLLVVLALTRVKRYTNNWQTGVFTVTAITTVAVFTSWVYNYQLHEHHSKNRKWLEVPLVSEGVLAELHCKKNVNCNALFHVDRILHDSVWVNVGGRIALRIHNGNWLREGDRIVVFAPFREIRPPLNAGDFNFKSYMAQRGVFWQANIDTTQLMLLSRFHEKGFVLAARRWREKLAERLSSSLFSERSRSVITALVFGDKRDLDPSLKASYSGSGVMHILAVSGMHIGTFYALFALLFGFLQRFRWGKVAFCVVLLILLWTYSFFTGLSPSVQRACLMYSMLLVGKLLNEQRDAFNLLSGSVIILLTASPRLLFDLGFLLSYCAVTGILLFYPLLYERWSCTQPLLDKVVSLVALSIAAQLGTLPISLYVFHQFPNYFLLGNFIVVPLALIVFYGTLVFLFFSAFPFFYSLTTQLGRLLNGVVDVLNYSVEYLHNLPYAVQKGIWINRFEMFLLYGVIISLYWWLYKGRRMSWVVGFIVLLVFYIGRIKHNWAVDRQNAVHFYAVKGRSVYGFVQGVQQWLVVGETQNSVHKYIKHRLESGRLSRGIKKVQLQVFGEFDKDVFDFCDFQSENYFIQFAAHRIAVIGKTPSISTHAIPIFVNTLVIRNNLPLQNDCFYEAFRFHRLVLDGSNSRRQAVLWCEDARDRGVLCYAVGLTGELTINL